MEDDRKIRELLKSVVAGVEQGGPRRDLWPVLLRRLHERPRGVPWFDWALLGTLAVWVIASPGVIPLLLYHL